MIIADENIPKTLLLHLEMKALKCIQFLKNQEVLMI